MINEYATWAKARISPNAPKEKVKEDGIDSQIVELKVTGQYLSEGKEDAR